MSEDLEAKKRVIEEIPAPAAQPPAESSAPAVEVPEDKKPTIFKRGGMWLFNPESKFGRFNRGLVRGLGWFAASFLVGFLVAFFALYQPEKAALQQANETIAEQAGEVENAKGQLQTANDEIARLMDELKQMQADLDTQTLRGGLYAALSQVNAARVALFERDGVAAKEALKSAADDLAAVRAELEALDPAAAKAMLARLAVAENELARNPEIAKQDLEILSKDLAVVAAGLE